MKAKDYALYKGDRFIDLGKLKDIAARTGIKLSYLYEMTAKDQKTAYILILIDENT